MSKRLATAVLALAASAQSLPSLAAQKTVVLSVPSMNCVTCPITVRKALQKVAGVANVKTTFEPPEAVVSFDDTKTAVARLIEATTNAGYPSQLKASQ